MPPSVVCGVRPMCSSHQPLEGADSIVYREFRVLLKDAEGPSWWVTVNAMGPNDARGLAVMKAYDQGAEAVGVIGVEEVVG